MQARFYLPMYGRFASPDPARDQHFENTQSWNIYSYVCNNPVMMTDPTGMFSFKDAWDYTKDVGRSLVGEAKGVAAVGVGIAKAVAHPVGTAKALGTAVAHPIATAKAVGSAVSSAVANANTPEQAGKLVGNALANIALVAAPFAGPAGQTAAVSSGAENVVNGLNLSKSLASEAQMGEVGSAMAGAGTQTVFRDAGRVAATYGGDVGDWAKMTSSSYKLGSPTAWENLGAPKSGASFETHWLENGVTGQRVEFKTVLPEH